MSNYTLITGASSGIGYEFAKIFAKNGCNLVLSARSKLILEDLAAELVKLHGVKVHVLEADLSNPEECRRLEAFCQNNEIFVENLINNAGVGDNEAFVDSDWKKQEHMIRLNIESLVKLTHMFLPKMVERKSGGILNVASTAAFQPGPFMAVYYATKAFVLSFSEALNEELKDTGVHVTSLCPGPTRSGFQEAAKMDKAVLFKLLNIPDAKVVAEYGYHAFKNKKAVAIHGFMNKIMVQSLRISPRILILKIVRFLQKK
ncbi:SDR family NAD(P)-dependent oxidoreductase [Bdellovibrio svalbardensis]|uniref:SDR family oxidoreductase n=1 Tax=Bdellovibrio svalbardensis TaxID=2972972 RepID=A0ABT6DHY2_9BACT|nr:SDR family oxidoreductase [Bdellovibrio svalbardensis]MDG0816403.1 SDR family oxidoreductase [Bdellovibrio svalbardensis]